MAQDKPFNLIGAAAEQQLDLFSYADRYKHRFAMVDIKLLNQGSFEGMLQTNVVSCVLDLREYPLFQSPKFKHKNIIDFMRGRNILYCPVSVLLNSDRREKFRALIRENRLNVLNGVILVVFDSNNQRMQVADARTRLSRCGNLIEINPRSFIRLGL